MYNVLERLRAGLPLTKKERLIHDQGLVSVLRQLHDDLDAAVLDAYGWPHDLSDDQIIERLVHLNTERAAEEAKGNIRWLRPDYQAPQSKAAKEARVKKVQHASILGDEDATEELLDAGTWPTALSGRMAIVHGLLAGKKSRTADALMGELRGSGARKSDVGEILDALRMLGRALVFRDEGGGERWVATRG